MTDAMLKEIRAREKNFEVISNVVKKYFTQNFKGTDLYFLFCIWRRWNLFVKKNQILSQAEPVYFQYGKLFLWAPNAVVIHELSYHGDNLIQDINKYFQNKENKKQVTKISFTANESLLSVRRRSFSKISQWWV